MAQVIWAPAALADIDAIADYIARDNYDAASLIVHRIVQAVEQLEEFPESGRIIPELNDPMNRELIVGVYRCMYRVVDNEVWITGVIHGAMNWKPC